MKRHSRFTQGYAFNQDVDKALTIMMEEHPTELGTIDESIRIELRNALAFYIDGGFNVGEAAEAVYQEYFTVL